MEVGPETTPRSNGSDFTFGVEEQHADLMNFTFDPIISPGNDDMLAAMQVIQNPTRWRNMMMPGLVVPRSLTHRSRQCSSAPSLCSLFWPTEEQIQGGPSGPVVTLI